MSRFLVSAAHKSSGKTTISIGLCAALTAQGLSVQAFKKGRTTLTRCGWPRPADGLASIWIRI